MNTEGKKRQLWTVRKKAQVVLEGLQGKLSAAELCRKYGITQSTYYEWRQTFIEKGQEGLAYGGRSKEEYEKDKRIAQLERMIGQLTIDNTILKKNAEWIERRKR